MGKAIVLNNIDFTNSNLGKVIFSDSAGNIPVTAIQTDSDKSTFKVGETATITAIVSPSGATNSNVRWSTSSNAIATLTSTGNTCTVVGLATGTVTITCTSESNSSIKSTEIFSVTDILLTNLTVNGSTGVTNNGKYTVSYLPANTTQTGVNWSTSNTNIATIDSAGNLTVVSNGVVTVTATSTKNNIIIGTMDVTCQLSVIATTGITLSSVGNQTILNIGNSLTINATVLPSEASNKAITWSVNNGNVSITSFDNEQCIISGLTAGNVTVTATSNANSGITASYNLTVQFVYITGITVTSNSETLRLGNSVYLGATMTPSNATDKAVIWSINSTGATISSNGDSCTVNAVSEGLITVTATAQDGSGVIGTWTTTILAALQVDTTLKVHLESSDYVESSESWVDRASNLTAYVYGSPAKSADGLYFSTTARYCRYCLDIASVYHGGSFTLFIDGTFSYFPTNAPSNRISGVMYQSGDSDYGIWSMTRGATDGLAFSNNGGSYYATSDATVLHRCVVAFDVPAMTTTIYGLNSSGVVVTKNKNITGGHTQYTDPFYAFTNASTFWLSNGYTIGTGQLGSTADANNNHTLKTIKLYNVVKSVEEITAMLTQ